MSGPDGTTIGSSRDDCNQDCDPTPAHGPSLERILEERRAGAPLHPSVRFRDLRHSHGAMLIAAGEHPKVIQAQSGHASTRTTLDTYGHLFDGLDEAAADRLDGVCLASCLASVASGLRQIGDSTVLSVDAQRTGTLGV